MSCFACQVAEKHPATTLRGPAGCLSCQARELAISHGGKAPEDVDTAMHEKWPETKTFRQGRTLFWNWVRAIEEAKEKNETRSGG